MPPGGFPRRAIESRSDLVHERGESGHEGLEQRSLAELQRGDRGDGKLAPAPGTGHVGSGQQQGVPPGNAGLIRLGFFMPAAPGRKNKVPTRIEVVPRLPEGAEVRLEAKCAFLDPAPRTLKNIAFWRGDAKDRFHFRPKGRFAFKDVKLAKGAREAMTLWVWVPPARLAGRPTVSVRQLYKETEIGRITWLFVPARPAVKKAGAAKARSAQSEPRNV